MKQSILLSAAAAAAIAAGCYTGGNVDPTASRTGPVPTATINGTEPIQASAFDGLPCDVAQVLATQCSSCHGTTPTGGAPNAMVTYDDLAAASATDASRSVAELSVERMNATKDPMPPTGADAAGAAILQKWVAAGMPRGSCDAPIALAPPDTTYDTATVCTSNAKWTRGDRGSASMHPGVACIDCHENSREGPRYSAAGTIYPTAHEPDDCNGTSAPFTVVITDATGKTFNATSNAVGNFFLRTAIKTPYTAKIVSGSKTRAMVGPQTNGDCNACHTEKGTQKAPGRLMAP